MLLEARALIDSRDAWIARGYGANAGGQWRPVGSPEAVRFTLLGAIIRAARGSKEALAGARALFTRVDPGLAARVSSDVTALTYEESLRLLDLAIASLEGAPDGRVVTRSGVVPRPDAGPSDVSLSGLGEAVADPIRRR